MPTLVLLAGPNGAGKTTFINRFLRDRAERFAFVNPDEVARSLAGGGPARDLAAGRLVLGRPCPASSRRNAARTGSGSSELVRTATIRPSRTFRVKASAPSKATPAAGSADFAPAGPCG